MTEKQLEESRMANPGSGVYRDGGIPQVLEEDERMPDLISKALCSFLCRKPQAIQAAKVFFF